MNDKGKIGWNKDNSFSNKIMMNQCQIGLLNYFDEKPRYITNSNTVVKCRHGNVYNDRNEIMSFSQVFSVVLIYNKYNCYNDTEDARKDDLG